MRMTTRKLLLGTAVLFAGVGVALGQGMHEHGGGGGGGGFSGGSAGAGIGAGGGGGSVGGGAQGMHEGLGGREHGGESPGIHNGESPGIHNRGAQVGAGASERSHVRAGAQFGGRGEKRETVGAGGQAERHGNTRGTAQIERGRVHGNVNARQQGTVGQAAREDNGRFNARQNEHDRGSARQNERENRNANAREHGTVGQGANEQNGRANVPNRANVRGENQIGANVEQNGGSRVQLTSRDRTRIRERVLSRGNIPRFNHVNFALRVGVAIPESVHFVAINDFPTLVDVFPEYRDDYFVVAEDDIVILSPQRRIVDVVPLRGSGHFASGGSGDVELSSAEIREVQQVLLDRGFDVEVDGVWGPATRHALITFQEREGLPPTGVITTRTVASLGLRGKIAASHVQSAAATTGVGSATAGQGNIRENGRMNARDNQPNLQQGQRRSNKQNARAPRNERSTTGQGRNEPNMKEPTPNRSTTGQDNSRPPQNQSMNGRGGGPSRSTTGQGGGGELRGGSNAPGQAHVQQSRTPQK